MMADFQQDFNTTLHVLQRLRDAFEHMTGTPGNGWSEKAQETCDMLKEWREEFGIEELARHAEAYEREERSGDE